MIAPASPTRLPTAEDRRLAEAAARSHAWRRFGPYLAERQWATVREDYSPDGTCWDYFPHDHARSRAYRWGEDGLLGWSDDRGILCFGLALWNGRDPILKERLFGLTGPEGNHGEDVKESYFYLDATPTYSYAKALYKYPQAEFPYARLVDEARRRSRSDPEFELADTGVFVDGRYFDVVSETAKAGPDDLLVRIEVTNRGPEPATLHLLPTLWFRNTWSWGRSGAGYWPKPRLAQTAPGVIRAEHVELGAYELTVEGEPSLLFTENESNLARLFGAQNPSPYVKDAFHAVVVDGRAEAANPARCGTKAAAHVALALGPGESRALRLRWCAVAAAARTGASTDSPWRNVDRTLARRRVEADEFYAAHLPSGLDPDARTVARQAYAGLLWSKQLFFYDVRHWLEGDPAQPTPPASRRTGRNRDWEHLNNFDVVSMPDKWEYPWYAAWDLAFHMIPMARVDPEFARDQLLLFTREWYMHPNGQLPAYEFALGDVNPPVHAWAAWRVYQASGTAGTRDRTFLSRLFHKLLLNFTWWVNRKDRDGRNLFGGGFLGLDNIGVFDRSQALPTKGALEQADGTAWMAFSCATMLAMALELAREDAAGEDMATKFFEHFVAIADAMNTRDGTGLWCPRDEFYYDRLRDDHASTPLRVRSLVGLVPMLACELIEDETVDRLPEFRARMDWFLTHRPEFARRIVQRDDRGRRWLLSIPSRDQLVSLLRRMLDEAEFLSPFGIRSVSKAHQADPYVLRAEGREYRVEYVPGESTTPLFGGNSNWRGPIWFPLNWLLVEALQRYHRFYGDDLRVECPTGSGHWLTLGEVAVELARRLASLFLPDGEGRRPCHGEQAEFAGDPAWRDLVLFHEYFHGESGRGLGASHQTGWTALVTSCLEVIAASR